MDNIYLERIYKERLEENLIEYIAAQKDLSLDDAMNAYYSSSLSKKIADGRFGIQYLDYRVLYQILLDTEPNLF